MPLDHTQSSSNPTNPAPRAPAWWRGELGLSLGLGLLILVFYANSFSAGLTMDNISVISQDPRLQALDATHLKLIFTTNYWWSVESNLYRPLTTLSYLFNYTVLGNGANLAGYHIVNFLLHWANACFVLLIVRRLGARLEVAALAAALFAVHPVNTEAVTNVVGRADLLSTLAILLGGWCYLRAAATAGGRKWAWLAGLGASAAAGVLCKENGVMIGGFVVLYDWLWRWPLVPGKTLRERLGAAAKEFGLRGYIALAPAVLVIGTVRYYFSANSPLFGEIYMDNPIAGATPFAGVMTAVGIMGRYLGLMVFPRLLSHDYSYHQIPLYGEAGNVAGDVLAWGSLALIVALLGIAFWVRRRQPLLAWGILFFFVMQLPTANLFLAIGAMMGERFMYLPSVGFCVVVALGLCRLGTAVAARLPTAKTPVPTVARWVLPVLIIILFGLRTLARNADWHDSISLAKSGVVATPASFKVYKGYATALWNEGHQDEPAVDAAIAQAEKGLVILDEVTIPVERMDPSLFYDLGIYYRLKGQFLQKHDPPDLAGAKGFYQKAVNILLRAKAVDAYINQTSQASLRQRGRPPGEIPDVGNHRIYIQLALAYARLGDAADSETAARWVQHLQPDEILGYLLAGEALEQAGRPADAAVQYLEVILLNRNNDEAWPYLARCYDALNIQPPPVTNLDTHHPSLQATVPLVRQQVNQAGAQIVQLFTDAKRPADAQKWRDQFIKDYHIPAEALSPK